MMDGITFNGRHSWLDFDLYIKTRDIGLPARKSIRQTVPYCNGSYDYSALAGVVAYEDRALKYTFDVTGDSPEELEEHKAAVCDWLISAQEAEIRDDVCPDWRFVGSCAELSWSPDENGLQGELGVHFACYPYKLAAVASTVEIAGNTPTGIYIAHAGAAVRAVSDVDTTVTDGTAETVLRAGKAALLAFTLRHGKNIITQTGGGTLRLTWREEAI